MIMRMLRRLQGHAPRDAAGDSSAAARTVYEADATLEAFAGTADSPSNERLDAASIEQRFLALVVGAAGIADDTDGARVETALHHMRMVAERFDVKRMPRLPALVPQLLASVRGDDCDAAQMATILARDPTLAGDVVRVANSALYRRSAAVTSLQQAVQTLGHEGLRHVVLTSVMRPILRAHPSQPGYASAELLWRQSEACAFLCSQLAPGRCDAGEAQLAGAVAGTGASALLRMAALPMLAAAGPFAGFAPGFLVIARRLTARASAHWHLPAEVRGVFEDVAGGELTASPVAKVLRASQLLSMAALLVESGTATNEDLLALDCGIAISRPQRIELVNAWQRERKLDAASA